MNVIEMTLVIDAVPDQGRRLGRATRTPAFGVGQCWVSLHSTQPTGITRYSQDCSTIAGGAAQSGE